MKKQLILLFTFLLFISITKAQVITVDGTWKVKYVELYDTSLNKTIKTSTDKKKVELFEKLKSEFLGQSWEMEDVEVLLEGGLSRIEHRYKFNTKSNKSYTGVYVIIGRENNLFATLPFPEEQTNKLEQGISTMKISFGENKTQRYFLTHVENREGGFKMDKICIRFTLEENL